MTFKARRRLQTHQWTARPWMCSLVFVDGRKEEAAKLVSYRCVVCCDEEERLDETPQHVVSTDPVSSIQYPVSSITSSPHIVIS